MYSLKSRSAILNICTLCSLLVDLDLFDAMVKFGHIGFCTEKNENHFFLKTVAALGLKVA